MATQPQTLMLVVSSEPERLARAALWALTAASVDDPVTVLLTAPALRALIDGATLPSHWDALRLPAPAAAFADARQLGAVVVTCDTELALSGVDEAVVRPLVDDIVALPSLWRAHRASRLMTL